MTSNVEYFFEVLLGHFKIFFKEMSIQIACPFLDWVVFFFFLNCGYKVSFYILDTNFLLNVSFANIFS